MKNKEVTVIGAGGHCRALMDIVRQIGYSITFDGKLEMTFVQDTRADASWPNLSKSPLCLLAVGQIEDSSIRRDIVNTARQFGKKFIKLISPTAYVSSEASLGEGVQALHHAVINCNTKVGEHSIINTSAVLEHDAVVGSFTHISTGAVVNGGSQVGSDCFVGSNAVISNGIKICDHTIIGAGSVVVKDIVNPGTYVGNPVRRIR